MLSGTQVFSTSTDHPRLKTTQDYVPGMRLWVVFHKSLSVSLILLVLNKH